METYDVSTFDGFWKALPASNCAYSITNETNHAILFGDGFNRSSYAEMIVVQHDGGFNGPLCDLDRRYFTPYYPTLEELQRWTSESHPLERHYKERIRAYMSANDKNVSEKIGCNISPIVENIGDVVDEMIKQVDYKKFKVILSATGSRFEDAKKHFVTDKVAKKYLIEWANNKAPIFMAFGKKLKLETDYESEITPAEFANAFLSLGNKYERYSLSLRMIYDNIDWNSLVANSMKSTSLFNSMLPTLHTKRKITTLCRALFEDDKFDADLGYLYQDKKIKRKLAISIDPCDYLTMSENKHNWQSCHNIHGGCFGGGGLTYMTDDATAISYLHNGEDYKYEINGFRFSHNSKEWRQCVYICSENGNAIFSRQYPRYNKDVCKAARAMYENAIAPDKTWIHANDKLPYGYIENSHLCYHDVMHGYNYDSVRLTPAPSGEVCVGGTVYCVHCGKMIESLYDDNGYRILCEDCFEDLCCHADEPAEDFDESDDFAWDPWGDPEPVGTVNVAAEETVQAAVVSADDVRIVDVEEQPPNLAFAV